MIGEKQILRYVIIEWFFRIMFWLTSAIFLKAELRQESIASITFFASSDA